MLSIRIQAVANAIAYLAMLLVNSLAVSLPIGGVTTAEIATRYPIYFLPANITFSIWGLIYLALGVFVVEQWRLAWRDDPRDESRAWRIGWLFVGTCLANCAWLIFFQNRAFVLSMVAMVALLLLLIAIYVRLQIGRPAIRRGRTDGRRSVWERWSIQVPFSLYLGWISVATIANASYVLYDRGWNGFGLSGQAWAIVMLFVAAGLALAIIADRRDTVYALVVVWAFLGIAARQNAVAPTVATIAELLAVLLVLAVVLRALRPRWQLHWRLHAPTG